MASPPKVFISAVSGDLRTVRLLVKDALLTIDCHPVEQTNFAPDWRTVEGMLRGKIEGCQALIHITGLRYGAEPDPATLPPRTARRSFTQMEYDIGRALQRERGDHGFRVYTFVCPPHFLYDTVGKDGAPVPVEDIALRGMQEQHRAALLADPHLDEQPPDSVTIQTRVTALREEVLTLRREEADVKREVQTTRRSGAWVAAAILLVLAGIGYWQRQVKRDTAGIKPIAVEMKDARAETRALLEQVIEQTRQFPAKGSESSPQERYDRALEEVAFKHDIKPADLRTAIDDWSAKVKADPEARAYDLALADFKDHHYENAAMHAATAYSRAMSDREKSTAAAIDAARLEGDSHRALAHFEPALAAYRRAAALTDREREPLSWAAEHSWVAWVLYVRADYAAAEPLLRAIVDIREQHLPANSPDVSAALNNLAQLLQATNRLAEAEPLMERALAIDEASFGKEHPNVAIRLNNLAALLQATNRLAEAEPLSRRMVGIFLKFCAENRHRHPNSMTCIRNYLSLCGELGLQPAEVHAHLEEQRSAAGLEPGAFAEIVREAREGEGK